MTERFKRSILKLLKQRDYRPVKLSRLAKSLDVPSEDYQEFKEAFKELRQAGHVILGSGNLISLPAMSGRVIGTFRAKRKGFGFVMPLEPTAHVDLFIPPGETGGAMSGDIVCARVKSRGGRGGRFRSSGRVMEILQRGENRFVGTLEEHSGGWLVRPDGTSFLEPISVDDVTAKNAGAGDKVVVEILSYPTERYLARGVIVEVLGKSGVYESEIKSVIRGFHLPEEFSESCLEQGRRAALRFVPAANGRRMDITEKVVVTIDPPDAKDFDDAISLEKDEDGRWVLGVHIADVSSFVRSNSALDEEAKDRGNSVYLPGRTIPMLPEILSNGVCSLQPGQDRFVKSVYITYDDRGKVVDRRYSNSLCRSSERLTYQQADRILKGNSEGFKSEVVNLLKDMEKLSRVIEKRRRREGMLHLDLPDTEIIMDDEGRVVDAEPADDSYPHTIIEMFMVESNEAVAFLLDGLNVDFIRRIHPEPDNLSLKNLAKLVRGFGIHIGRNPGRKEIQELLEGVKGGDMSLPVNLAVLRSLEKAEYALKQIGHYALASEHYCHFTSPIRRYADLPVHRLLQRYLTGKLRRSRSGTGGDEDAETAKHISFTEQRAEDAERELKTILILQMLSGWIGRNLDCVVTGVAGFGVFCQSRKFGVEGLIPIEELEGDRWRYNGKQECIVGERSGCTIHLGQAIETRIVSVDVSSRRLSLVAASSIVGGTKGGRKKVDKKGKGKRSVGRGKSGGRSKKKR